MWYQLLTHSGLHMYDTYDTYVQQLWGSWEAAGTIAGQMQLHWRRAAFHCVDYINNPLLGNVWNIQIEEAFKTMNWIQKSINASDHVALCLHFFSEKSSSDIKLHRYR